MSAVALDKKCKTLMDSVLSKVDHKLSMGVKGGSVRRPVFDLQQAGYIYSQDR